MASTSRCATARSSGATARCKRRAGPPIGGCAGESVGTSIGRPVATGLRVLMRTLMAGRISALIPALLLATCLATPAHADETACSVGQGSLHAALAPLQAAHAAAAAGPARAEAAARLGAVYLQLARLDAAEPLLDEAVAGLAGAARARAWMDRGLLHLARQQPAAAEAAFAAAAGLAGDDAELGLAAALNGARSGTSRTTDTSTAGDADTRAGRLQALAARITGHPGLAPAARARLLINLAGQARDRPGAEGAALAWPAYDEARRLALAEGDARLAAEALDGLAALYETAGRADEALRLTEQGIGQAARLPAPELLMTLEARAGRLARRLGQADLALAAHRRAVQHIESVRNDIPVTYLDGQSSFRLTLEPTYLGLTDLLLQRAAGRQGAEQQALLRQARDTAELIKQTELEDYLRDRCSVGAARQAQALRPAPGTAIYYPIILPDRLELLLETGRGIERRSVAVDGAELRRQVLDFVAALRAGNPLQARAQALYRWLLAPLDEVLAAQQIHTLVGVPDGALRLLPLASLHDGRGWLIERLAVATVPALSLAPAARPQGGLHEPLQALLAGMSEPGPVVDRLPEQVLDSMLDPASDARQRSGAARSSALRDALALPGVKQEINSIAQVLPGTVLLDQGFTLEALRRQLRSGDHRLVHIASHGVFGDSADSTFIMTYDELLTLDGLQALLREGGRRRAPIELLTLSACQTAEGDDRAPLGMSGTALKARARSALGTLWPVADDAAQQVMAGFYRRLAQGRLPRVEALRQAQLELLRQPRRGHPFYWAPFVLIGDWQ